MSIWSSASDLREHIQLSHDPENCFQVNLPALKTSYPSFHTPTTIGAFAFLLAFNDKVNQPLIFRRMLLPFSPRIIPAAGYLKNSAHISNCIFLAEALDNPILQLHLLPASDRKFRSKSTVILS